MPVNSQLGIKAETTWGTAVTVDRFYEFNSESINLETGRIESPSMRSTGRVQRSDRSVPYVKGAAGNIELDVLTKNMGLLLKHSFGTVDTSSAVDSCYTHTFWPVDLYGLGLTAQINRALHPAGTDQAFTWAGVKIVGGSFEIEKEGHLKMMVDIVSRSETTGTALASASYATGTVELFTWAGAALTVNGTALKVEDFKVEWSNGLNTDRYKLASSTARQEPTANGFAEITGNFTADFENLTRYNHFNATTAGSNVGTVELTCTAPTLAGTATYPSFKVTLPAFRFDEAPVNVGDMEGLTVAYAGKALFDGTSQAMTVTYVTTDATP